MSAREKKGTSLLVATHTLASGPDSAGYGYLLCSRMAKIYADDFTFVK
jgi:hypothetical protein